MFSANVVGTANATAAGWGNLGGVTQIFMISVLFNPMVESGMAADRAWRVSMIVPAVLFFLALCCCDEALVLGHSQCQALRCGCHWQDPEAVLVGLCGSPKRCSRACDDLSVFCWL